MKPPTTIITAAAIHVSTMLASAIILVAVAESLHWFLCWKEAREV